MVVVVVSGAERVQISPRASMTLKVKLNKCISIPKKYCCAPYPRNVIRGKMCEKK